MKSESLDRLFRAAFASGIRVFDTAEGLRHRARIQEMVRTGPEIRKQIFLVTKDGPKPPGDMRKMVDERLASLGTDYIDLFFIHGLGDDHSLDEAMNFVKSLDFKEAAEAIRKSGKAKFIGFSTHHKNRAQIIQAAAEGDRRRDHAPVLPWLEKDSPLNKAARRVLGERDRPDHDEADRRQAVRR